MFTTRQVARKLGVCKSTIHSDVRRQLITPTNIKDSAWKFSESEVTKYAAYRRTLGGDRPMRKRSFHLERLEILGYISAFGLEATCEDRGMKRDVLLRSIRNWRNMRNPDGSVRYPQAAQVLESLPQKAR